MKEMNERKRSADCDNVHQTRRYKIKRLEDPSCDVLDRKKPNLEKLPSKCLQHIFSFLTYEKGCQLRQVSKVFDATGIKRLDKGHKELESRLTREIEKAEKKTLFPTNVRSSYDVLNFLNGLHVAINNCTITYSFYIDYFVAGKVLDEANYLLKNFNSLTTVPYFQEQIYDEKPHPLLGPIVAHSKRAYQHYKNKVLPKPLSIFEGPEYELEKQNDLELDILEEENDTRITKTILLENRKQKINCGNKMSKEFLKLILNLNEKVLHLAQWVIKIDEEIERVIKGMSRLNKDQGNCLFKFSMLFSSPPRAIKSTVINGSKLANLATLPFYCIGNIISYFNCNKMAQLRIVCNAFNEACKKELNGKFEILKQNLEFEIKYNEKSDMHHPIKLCVLESNIMKDVRSFLQLCKDNYKWYLGTNYYFAAGKVLDEARYIYDRMDILHNDLNNYEYKSRPHCSLFRLMDVVYEAIAHFKFDVMPKHFPLTQNPIYTPNYIITGDATDFEKESQLNLEDIEKLIEEADGKIKEQNNRNSTFLKIIFSLKKKVIVLNKKISERIIVLKEL